MSGGWSPVVHLWSHCGGKLNWDETNAMFSPDPARPPLGADGNGFVLTAGTASGDLGTAAAMKNAITAGRQATNGAGFTPVEGAAPVVVANDEDPMMPIWSMPQGAPYKLRLKSWLDFQNDVKVSDVRLAAQEATKVSNTLNATPPSGWPQTRENSPTSTV